jgi:hypothetical protein
LTGAGNKHQVTRFNTSRFLVHLSNAGKQQVTRVAPCILASTFNDARE